MMASASANCVGFATGTLANAARATAAPLFSSISSGTSSGTCHKLASPAGAGGDRLRHLIDMPIHAVKDDLNSR